MTWWSCRSCQRRNDTERCASCGALPRRSAQEIYLDIEKLPAKAWVPPKGHGRRFPRER